MPIETTWLDRLIEAVDASGRSMRDISLGAGFGHAYLREVIELGKEPRLGSLLAICAELNISVHWVLTGLPVSDEAERLVHLMAHLSPERQEEILHFLERILPAEGTQPREYLDALRD